VVYPRKRETQEGKYSKEKAKENLSQILVKEKRKKSFPHTYTLAKLNVSDVWAKDILKPNVLA